MHPSLGAYGELLLAERHGWPNWPPGAADRPFFWTYLNERGSRSRIDRHRQLFDYLDYLYEPRRDFRAIGFKLMYDEATPYPELIAYMKRRNVHVLHLIRTNLLDVALSQIAMSTRRFPHAWSPDQREELAVQVDTRYMMKLLWVLRLQRLLARSSLRTLRLPVHELSYETATTDDAALHSALRFLGLSVDEDIDLPSTMLKLAPSSHREGIANFDEVESSLRGTRFHRHLRP